MNSSGIERLSVKQKVDGASPSLLSLLGVVAQLVEHLLCKQGVVVSSTTFSTIHSGADDINCFRLVVIFIVLGF